MRNKRPDQDRTAHRSRVRQSPQGKRQNGEFIHIVNVSKSYLEGGQKRTILDRANLSIAKGQIVAILGRSGSGKSTLLNLISGIDSPDSGSIWIEERELTRLSENVYTLFRREKIGFIFQFFNLIPTLTVIENIALPAEIGGVDAKHTRSLARALLEEVNLAGRENAFPDRLSGGEQQRVAIARALICDPLLVLADEPTGNLDEESGNQVLDLLNRLTRRAGKNLIIVTHNRDAASLADRVLVLHDGQLLENDDAGPRNQVSKL